MSGQMSGQMSGILVYDSNNSGGSWWLSKKDYDTLEEKGWIVHWLHDITQDHGDYEGKGDEKNDPHAWARSPFGRDHNHHFGLGSVQMLPAKWNEKLWLGAAATSAAKRFETPESGVREWEELTEQSAKGEGCNCCGPPHSFEWTDDATGEKKYTSVHVTETELEWD